MAPDTPDRRRRQYVPLYVYFAHGNTGTRLLNKLGPTGLLAWIAYLAACKRNPVQGRITYISEDDAWRILGLENHRPDWPIDKLWALTGQLKQTHRRRVGHVLEITCTRWGDWEQNTQRHNEAEKKRRKRAETTGDKPPTKHRRPPAKTKPLWGTEGEGEDNPLGKASPSPSPTGGRRRSAPRASSLRAAEPPPNGDATVDPEGIKRIAKIMRNAATAAHTPDPDPTPEEINQRQEASRRRLHPTHAKEA